MKIFDSSCTKVEYRAKDDMEINTLVFRGAHAAEKAAKFVIANKKTWDFHVISTIHTN